MSAKSLIARWRRGGTPLHLWRSFYVGTLIIPATGVGLGTWLWLNAIETSMQPGMHDALRRPVPAIGLLEESSMHIALWTCLCLLAASVLGCDRNKRHVSSSDNGRERTTLRYPYAAPASRRQEIIDGCRQIRTGMTEKDVLSLMGEPDERNPTYEPKIKNPRQIGFSYVYVVQRLKPSGSVDDMQEKSLRIHFDQLGSVVDIVPVGMPNPGRNRDGATTDN